MVSAIIIEIMAMNMNKIYDVENIFDKLFVSFLPIA